MSPPTLLKPEYQLIQIDDSRSKTPTPGDYSTPAPAPAPAPAASSAKPFIHPSRQVHVPANLTEVRRPSGVQQQREPDNVVASNYDRQNSGGGGRYAEQSEKSYSRSVSQVSYPSSFPSGKGSKLTQKVSEPVRAPSPPPAPAPVKKASAPEVSYLFLWWLNLS